MTDVKLNGVDLKAELEPTTLDMRVTLPGPGPVGGVVTFPTGYTRSFLKTGGWEFVGVPPDQYDELSLRRLAVATNTRNKGLVVQWLQLTSALLVLDLPTSAGPAGEGSS